MNAYTIYNSNIVYFYLVYSVYTFNGFIMVQDVYDFGCFLDCPIACAFLDRNSFHVA